MSLLTLPPFTPIHSGLRINAIDPETSPADYLRTQHPKGDQYAKYLRAVAVYHELPIRTGVRVHGCEEGDHFIASTDKGEILRRIS